MAADVEAWSAASAVATLVDRFDAPSAAVEVAAARVCTPDGSVNERVTAVSVKDALVGAEGCGKIADGVDDVGGVEVPEAEVVGVDAGGSRPARPVDKLDEVADTTPATAAVGDAAEAVGAGAAVVAAVKGTDADVATGAAAVVAVAPDAVDVTGGIDVMDARVDA
jgi:hypothetical protein